MKIKKKEVEQRMKHFETVCRGEGIKLTHQRIEIFREVAQTGDHPDADQVFQRVRDRVPTVSLDTVYRTLWLLNDLGLVVTLSSSRERTRFDANLDSHHHFVCRQCGFTRDFYSNDLDNIRLPDSLGPLGEIEATHVEVRGICQECIEKGRKKNPFIKTGGIVVAPITTNKVGALGAVAVGNFWNLQTQSRLET